jgi:hypothetical protein
MLSSSGGDIPELNSRAMTRALRSPAFRDANGGERPPNATIPNAAIESQMPRCFAELQQYGEHSADAQYG